MNFSRKLTTIILTWSQHKSFSRCSKTCNSLSQHANLRKSLNLLTTMVLARFRCLSSCLISRWCAIETSRSLSEKSTLNAQRTKGLLMVVLVTSPSSSMRAFRPKQGSIWSMLKRNNFSVNSTPKWEFWTTLSPHSSTCRVNTMALRSSWLIWLSLTTRWRKELFHWKLQPEVLLSVTLLTICKLIMKDSKLSWLRPDLPC